jgi:hypothetical protein
LIIGAFPPDANHRKFGGFKRIRLGGKREEDKGRKKSFYVEVIGRKRPERT